MPNDNRSLGERVEVFTRATSEALNKAIGEVLEAKGPWQLLYRLSRIVLLGIDEQDSPAPTPPTAGTAMGLGPERQQELLLLIARRLEELLDQRWVQLPIWRKLGVRWEMAPALWATQWQ